MGFLTNLLVSFGLLRKKANLIVVGLDNSGKSSIVNQMKPDKLPNNEVVPTVGFAVELFAKGRLSFTVFDMSGQGRYRDLWEHYFPDVDGIVFVVDSADRDRLCVARDELEALLQHKVIQAKRIPILFLANKNDVSGTMTAEEVASGLNLKAVSRDKSWHICSCSAVTGVGLEEGFQWVIDQLS